VSRHPQQQSLFFEEDPHAHDEALERRFRSLTSLAQRLPANVKMGTSSWSFPGWGGIVFPKDGYSQTYLAQEGLRLYTRHPLLRTVGIDRGYYAPIPIKDLERYAEQLPPGFPTVLKAPASYTSPVHLGHSSSPRGTPNSSFLDAASFHEVVAAPLLSAFRDHTAAVVLEFPPVPVAYRLSPKTFAQRLDTFLGQTTRELPLCVEIRNKDLLTPAYADVLRRHGAAHVFNYWSSMPMPARQLPVAPLESAPFVVLRLMLRPGTRYEERKSHFAPFDRIVDPDPDMRNQVASIVEVARSLDKVVLILVNNKAEGSAPLTIEQLAEQLVTSP
jgi:uncharacterized protein YecE (DUF72 family)